MSSSVVSGGRAASRLCRALSQCRFFGSHSIPKITSSGESFTFFRPSVIRKDGSYATLQFFRGISEIRFDHSDTVWLGLWQTVKSLNPNESLVPVVEDYMKNYEVEKHHILSVIYKLRINAKFAQAAEICKWLIRRREFKVEDSDHILHLELVGRVSKYAATRLFWDMPAEKRSEKAYMAILSTFARWHAVPAAEDMMSEMKGANLITSVEPYNIMMDMYKRKNMDDKIRALYAELRELKISPDLQTYLIILRARERIGGFVGIEDEARKFVAQESQKKQPLFNCECITKIYALLGDSKGVERMCNIMKKMGRLGKVSMSTYGCMFEAYKQLREVDKAERLFNDMGNRFRLSARQYRDLIAVYTENGEMEKANELYKQLFRSGLECHPGIYHSIVLGYLKIKDYENALIAYGKARDRGVLGHPKPLRATIMAVMTMLAEQGDIKNAERVVHELRFERQGHDVDVYNLLLKAYIKAEVPVFGFDGRMLQAGVSPNDESLELLKKINLPPKKRRASDQTTAATGPT